MTAYNDRRYTPVSDTDYESQRGSITPSVAGGWKFDRRRRSVGFLAAALCFLSVVYCGAVYFLPDAPVSSLELDIPFWDTPIRDQLPLDARPHKSDIADTLALKDDPTQVLVPQRIGETEPLLRPIRQRPPANILEAYYGAGTVPYVHNSTALPPVDVVFLWVNASGDHFQEAMEARAGQEGVAVQAGSGKRFRDNGELRGAVRSAKGSINGLGNIHVLSADLGVEEDSAETQVEGELVGSGMVRREVEEPTAGVKQVGSGWKLGQIPVWLDWEAVRSGAAGLKWHFHSSIFRIPVDDLDAPEEKALDGEFEAEWRDVSVPSFNSFVIESRVGWVDGLAENFVLANDDMFLLANTTATDYHHPLLGDVLRIDGGLLVKPHLTPDLYSTTGEWGGLQHAAEMIARRFPSKKRGYMLHVPKSLTVSLAHEASVMWEEELTEAATRGFRRSTRGLADVEMSWLTGYLRIERWREALLWSWAVARLGGEQGFWGDDEKEEVRGLLGLNDDPSADVVVQRGIRRTLDVIPHINLAMGWDDPMGTEYTWSSMDGLISDRPGHEHEETTCTFMPRICLPADFYTSTPLDAEEMFTHLTFVEPRCGDCLIKALITASGERGLDAVLPRPEQTAMPEIRSRRRWDRSEPMLPLTDTWEQGNFSLYSVIRPGQDQWMGTEESVDGSVNLRQWSIKLLSRYAYVLGSTKTHFSLIHNLKQLHSALRGYDQDRDVVMACVNDDQPDDGPPGISEFFSRWMLKRWGDVEAPWERLGAKWNHEKGNVAGM